MADEQNMSGSQSQIGGLSLFAGMLMVMIGIFGILQGMAALSDSEFFVIGLEYVYKFDISTWGWIHLLMGILILAAGFGVFKGQTWARAVGITLAVISAIANFAFIPYYPVWTILIIVMNITLIWALANKK
jgi:hypothetical protein